VAESPFPPVPSDPAAARALLQAEGEALRARKQQGLLDSGLHWLAEVQQVLGEEPALLWFQLELHQHAQDLPQQVAISRRLILHPQRPPESGLAHLRRLHFAGLLGLAGGSEADAALAALPGGETAEDQRHRLRQAALLAQHRYRFRTARALLLAVDALCEDDNLDAHRLAALERAERLALMEGRLAEALRIRERIRELLRASDDPEQRHRAGAEPMRQWRLELGANPAALEELEASRALPAAQACRAVAAALERHPESTALAFGLLLALRQAGWVGAASEANRAANGEASGEEAIPRRLWLLRRHPAASEGLAELEQRWRQLHPGWQLHWLDHDLDHEPEPPLPEPLPPLVQAACSCVNDPAIRADLLRLALLWQHGGVAVDWNSRPQRPLNDLLAGASLLLVQDADGAIGPELFAATPRHPWVREALEQGCRNALSAQGYSRWDVSGASLLSGVFARWSRAAIAAGALPQGLRLVSVHELRQWLGLGLPLPRPPQLPEEPPLSQLFNQQRRRLAVEELQQRPPAQALPWEEALAVARELNLHVLEGSRPGFTLHSSERLRLHFLEGLSHSLHVWREGGPEDLYIATLPWRHQSRWFRGVRQLIERVNPALGPASFVVLANEAEEMEAARAEGFVHAVHCNQNAWLDPACHPLLETPEAERLYKVVINCRPESWKRPQLALGVEPLAVIEGASYRPWDRIDLKALLQPAWINASRLSTEEVVQVLNQAKVGGIFSEEEGACWSSSEFLLCGLPVVSTESRGGRACWYTADNALVIPPTPEACRAAVRELADRCAADPSLRQRIRQAHINQAMDFRRVAYRAIDAALEQRGVAACAEELITASYQNKMVRYLPL